MSSNSRIWLQCRCRRFYRRESFWSNFGRVLVCPLFSRLERVLLIHGYTTHSQENIFKPLGMGSTFYRTPEVEAKILKLSFRRDGKLEPWSGQSEIIEQDPSKGQELLNCQQPDSLTKKILLVSLFLGGVGLYSSLRDYLTFLRHILQLRGTYL